MHHKTVTHGRSSAAIHIPPHYLWRNAEGGLGSASTGIEMTICAVGARGEVIEPGSGSGAGAPEHAVRFEFKATW